MTYKNIILIVLLLTLIISLVIFSKTKESELEKTQIEVTEKAGIQITPISVPEFGEPEKVKIQFLSHAKGQVQDPPKAEKVNEVPKIPEKGTSLLVEPQKVEEVKITLDSLAEKYNTYKQYYSADNTCHPYLIAAIHYRETNFGNSNAWNGQGAFQNLSNRYEPNSVVLDWETQVQQACLHLKGKVGVQTLLDLNDEELIGTALARYNGCRGLPYGQCSYVVNKTHYMSSGTKCAVDGCSYLTTDNRFGALSIINQLSKLS